MLVEVVLVVTSVLPVVVSDGVEITLEADDGVAPELVSDGDVLAEPPADGVELGREVAGVDSALEAAVELVGLVSDSVDVGTDVGLAVADVDGVELRLGDEEAVGTKLDGEADGLVLLDVAPVVVEAPDEEDSELGVVELVPVGDMLDAVAEPELVLIVALNVAESGLDAGEEEDNEELEADRLVELGVGVELGLASGVPEGVVEAGLELTGAEVDVRLGEDADEDGLCDGGGELSADVAVGVETGVDGLSVVGDALGAGPEGASMDDDEGCKVVWDDSALVGGGCWVEPDGLSPGADELLTGVGMLCVGTEDGDVGVEGVESGMGTT